MAVRGEEPPAVEVCGVSRHFDGGGHTVYAVRDVSLTVLSGELLAIVGRSGSGKTTLLNLIAGLDRPDEGSVYLDGRDITSASEAELTALRRNHIGFVFQSFGLLPLLSAAENIALALRIAGVSAHDEAQRTRELLEMVGLSARAGHRPYELSGGEQQRVAVARALANHPRLLIADEPTGELDTVTGAQIFGLLQQAATEGVTIVMATHDPLIVDYAHRVVEMADGRLVDSGEVKGALDQR
ncbi:MAG: ABC transporter ATP-binding protein [Dehalococcoidia bacterium]|nr:MAG: ABC transporter ATP-binding protein [Dehalococcoidia bacterium]